MTTANEGLRIAFPVQGWKQFLVLEYAGTPEARQVLKHLAGGMPQAVRTREAKASLDRWR